MWPQVSIVNASTLLDPLGLSEALDQAALDFNCAILAHCKRFDE